MERCIINHDSESKKSNLGSSPFVVSDKKIRLKRNTSLNFGCGYITEDEDGEKIFQREYPQVWNGTTKQAEFVPENFFCRSVSVIDENFSDIQIEERAKNKPKNVKGKGKAHSALHIPPEQLYGDIAERFFYDNLKKLFHSEKQMEKTSDIVVLHSVDAFFEDKYQETDFVILSPKRKLIIVIEVKHSYDFMQKNIKTKVKKALKQIKAFKEIMRDHLSDVLNSSWKFLSILFFYEFERGTSFLCDDCSPWVLHKGSNLVNWWETVEEKFPLLSLDEINQSKLQFNKLFGRLVFKIHRAAITQSETSAQLYDDLTKKVGTPQNILFWTKEQCDIMMNENNKRVMFTTTYGTGKTLLMCEKSKQLAGRGENVTFILWTSGSTQKTLLHLSLEKRFKDANVPNNVEVLTSKDIMEIVNPGVKGVNFLSRHLLRYLQLNPNNHIMIDEWYWAESNDNSDDFQKCLDEANDRFLWITWHRNTKTDWETELHSGLKNACTAAMFVTPKLIHPMRNSRLIINEAKVHGGEEGSDINLPTSFYPEGIAPVFIPLNDGRNEDEVKYAFMAAIEAARKRSDKGVVVVMNTEPIGGVTEKEFLYAVQAIKDICVAMKELCVLYALHNRYEKENFGKAELFIERNDGILITDHRAVEGYEAETIIAYAGRERQTGHMSSANFFMRCVSSLIVIQQPDHVHATRQHTWDDYIFRFKQDNSNFDIRRQSFHNWPTDAVQRQNDFAMAGFYYMGVDDLIKCFSCGAKKAGNTDFDLKEEISYHCQK